MESGMEQNFAGLFEKVGRSPDHFEMIRFHVAFKVLLGIPFFQKQEIIFIGNTRAEIAAAASLIHSYGLGQGCDRLRKLLVLPGNDFHFDDDEDHEDCFCKGSANI